MWDIKPLFANMVWLVMGLCLVRGDPWQKIQEDIDNHRDVINQITDYVLRGPAKHLTYNRLANFTDKWGPRVTGTKVLEDSIDDMLRILENEGLENVTGEPVQVPHWVRGEEWAAMVEPRKQKFQILGLGTSVGTQSSHDGILEAEAVVVTSFVELSRMNESDVRGKIVVFDQGWSDYSHGRAYRHSGAAAAAKKGAVGALIRSITGYSLYAPHTGSQAYEDGIAKIPVACITVEDAEMLHRIYNRGQKIKLQLYMEAKTLSPTTSRNIVAEIRGTEHPHEVVIIGGHIDSWDVGMGVMDDGGGVFISVMAMHVLKQLNLIPRRTIRLVLWTAEEQIMTGAKAYFEAHKNESDNIVIAMESDQGTFSPFGIGFSGSADARDMVTRVMSLMDHVNATMVGRSGSSPDTTEWEKINVPVASLWAFKEEYFNYHHTHADSLSMMDPDDLDLCTVVWASSAYTFANLQQRLPRQQQEINKASGFQRLWTALLCFHCLVSLLHIFHLP